MRIFVALRPSPAALDHLESALAGVRAGTGLALRWSDPSLWHLTLAFRADLPGGALEDAVQELARIAAQHRPLELQLSGAGVFSARTLWIGMGGDTESLTALMGESLLAGEDGGRERRRAHLTVARVSARAPRPPRRRRRGEEPPPDPTQLLLAEAVRALSVYRGPTWQAMELDLVESQLTPGRSDRPRHEVLAAVPLG